MRYHPKSVLLFSSCEILAANETRVKTTPEFTHPMRLPVIRGWANFLKGGDIPRKSVPREGKFPRNIIPQGAILQQDGFPGTPDGGRINGVPLYIQHFSLKSYFNQLLLSLLTYKSL